ncbi:hypothetical protein [Endozoicomonas ascidiicola]|uniref:hypothetical protein n=1 Tax=Endozoicomonas ascidiicola TaxID=1698521 RepID=UPI00082CA52E|nr:hypothetical protein [Endozoicomonas ascidiicola]
MAQLLPEASPKASPEKRPKKRDRLQLALVFLIPTTAMALAWTMYFTGVWVPDGRTNKGELLLPPAQLADIPLRDGGQAFIPDETDGLWRIVVFGSTECTESQCQESLYKTRQVHIALNKEAERVARFFISPEAPKPSEALESEHPGIYWLAADKNTIETVLGTSQWPSNQVFIIDPLGNVIMSYQPEQPGGDLLNDLKKLLRASSIG